MDNSELIIVSDLFIFYFILIIRLFFKNETKIY